MDIKYDYRGDYRGGIREADLEGGTRIGILEAT